MSVKSQLKKSQLKKIVACFTLVAAPAVANAQSAGTSVDVGPGQAGASGIASGQWQLVDSSSRVGNGTSLGNALAVGAGPNGVAISHSVGVNGGGGGAAHNFNLAIGAGGTHVSHGGVVTAGGNSRVIAGGSAQNGFAPQGGSSVGGFGNNTQAYSNSQTTPAFRNFGPPTFGQPSIIGTSNFRPSNLSQFGGRPHGIISRIR